MTNFIKTVLLCLVACFQFLSISLSSAQNISSGEQVFNQCRACHSTNNSTNDVGPNLLGVFNRKIGSISDYRYSKALRNANGTWDKETLNRFLENPQASFPGNRMPYSGMSDKNEREALIDYLATLKP